MTTTSTALSTDDRAREASLVSRLQARDPLALAELYDQYGSYVYRAALALVRDAAAAEQLTQEAFLHIWNRIAAFDSARGHLAGWVRVVARNLTIDYIRSAEFRIARLAAPLECADGRPESRSADRLVAQWERVRLLEGPWKRLRPCDRRALGLAYYGGLSQPEIAQRLGRPLGTVKTWMRRGLQSLRAELEGCDACW